MLPCLLLYLLTHAQTQTRTQTHRHTNTQTHRHTDRQTHTHTERHTHTHTQRQRHTDTQTHRHADTQTRRHTHTHTKHKAQKKKHADPSFQCPEGFQMHMCENAKLWFKIPQDSFDLKFIKITCQTLQCLPRIRPSRPSGWHGNECTRPWEFARWGLI